MDILTVIQCVKTNPIPSALAGKMDQDDFIMSSFRTFCGPKTSPNDGDIPRRPREIWRFKNRANIENRGNREIGEIRETGKLRGEGSGFFAYFAYFAVQRISQARIWGGPEGLTAARAGRKLSRQMTTTKTGVR
jgi:hypothetical protein